MNPLKALLRPACVLLAAFLAATAPLLAQDATTSDDNMADRLAQLDRDIEKLGNDIDDFGRRLNNAIAEGQEDWARLANGGLLPGFAEQLSAQLPWFELQPLSGGAAHDRSCSNTYGATLEVPFGSYEGNQILNLSETTLDQPVFPVGSEYNRALSSWGGAWSFEPGGMLIRMVELVDAQATVTPEPRQYVDCTTTIRYRYVGARGDYTFTKRGIDDEICHFHLEGSADPKDCGTGFFGGARFPAPCPRGDQYWSTHGQVALDMSNGQAPRLIFPDGTIEVMGHKGTDWPQVIIPPFGPSSTIPFYAHHQSLYTGGFSFSAFSKEAYWTTDRLVDRNGNRTRFEYDSATGWVSGVVDPRGRRTSYSRNGLGYITAISQPSFGGASLTWTLTWQDFTWQSPNNDFPEVNCVSTWNPVTCPAQPFTTLTRLTLPDGRAYDFTYGPWGNLTRVAAPGGAVTVYEYGDHQSSWFKPPFLNYIDGFGASHFGDRCPDKMKFILKRRLVRTTVTPSPGAPPQVTSVDHAQEVQLRTTSDPHACYIAQWIHTTRPDGTVRKTAICQGNAAPQGFNVGSPPTAVDGRILAEEVWGPGGLVEGTYYGNTGTIGDFSTPIGTMYLDWETPATPPALIPSTVSGNIYDTRPNKVVHFRDGIQWSETFTYDVSDIPANLSQFRTFGNVTSQVTFDALGSALRRAETTFVTDPAYVAKNLIRLPDTTVVRQGGGGAVTRTRFAYDQFPLMTTGSPSLEDPGAVRGNVTTTTAYKLPKVPAGEVVTTQRYFDDGEQRQTTDPRGAQTTISRPPGDFAECAVDAQDTETTTNALGHAATVVRDCWSGQPLTVTDPNGQITRTTYDRLSRTTTVTGPGDTTPTQWFEYYLLNSNDNTGGVAVTSMANQRTVVHSKDGSTDGLYVKTFIDGLGRTAQTRAEVDPATSNGFAEAVTTTEFDVMGRAYRNHTPCFGAASNAQTASCTDRVTVTQFDALGRVTSVTPPGLPAVTTVYGGSGTLWVATTTNGRGFQSKSFTNAIGQNLKASRQWANCPGGWCDTNMTYDAAGRLLTLADPAGNTSTMTYDGLGRKLTLSDPDMGGFAGKGWTYTYDDNGNLTSQTDAKGQTINLQYDLLNRITLRDLPPAGPGEEDVTFYYDGLLPATCYGCDDRCATTADTCDTASLTCRHTGTPCDGSTPPTCTYTIAPTSQSFPSGGGSGSVAVTTTAGCAWTATSNAAWITVTSGASGTGNGTVGYSVAANTGTSSRNGTVTIAGQTFTVSQAAPPPPTCTYSLSPTSTSVAAAGGTGTVSVTTAVGCPWTASSDVPWLTVTSGGSGSGSGTVSYSVAANTGVARVGHLTIGGQLFSVSQAAATCTFTFTPPSASIGSGAGTYSVAVATSCTWSATSNASFITIVSGSSGSGNGTVTYSVTANAGTKARGGSIIIGNQLFSITQAAPGAGCSYSTSPISQSYGSGAASGSVTVTAGAGCAWTATSNAAWITVTAGASGSGNGTVSYTIGNNTGTSSRTGTITIAGQSFTVTQAGSPSGPPVAPSGLTATPQSSSQIALTWTDNSADETSFSIERKTGVNGTWSTVGSVGANVTTYTDSGLAASTQYFYRVRSANSVGLSAPSNEASATTGGSTGVPAAPSFLQAVGNPNFFEIDIFWADNSNNETTFRLERASGNQVFSELVALGPDATSWLDSNVSPFTTYTYRVRACNASGCSAYSNTSSAIPGQ